MANGRNVAIVLNGISKRKKRFYRSVLPALQIDGVIDVLETEYKGHAEALAFQVSESGKYQFVLAAGGDGTLNQVVNGVLRSMRDVIVGLIPMGSGNDFARAMGLKFDAGSLNELLVKNAITPLDIGKINCVDFNNHPHERYFINVADVGMGPEVVRRVEAMRTWVGGAVAYYLGILRTFISYRPMIVQAVTSEWKWQGKLRSLAVANGSYYGHGLCIAPDAKPDDGILQTFICGNVSVFDFIRYSEDLKRRRFLKVSEVTYGNCKSIHLSADVDCLAEVDGEVIGRLPATVSLHEKQLRFLK